MKKGTRATVAFFLFHARPFRCTHTHTEERRSKNEDRGDLEKRGRGGFERHLCTERRWLACVHVSSTVRVGKGWGVGTVLVDAHREAFAQADEELV